MQIIEIDTTDRRQVQQFIELPFRLYKDTPQWVPPLAPDMRRMLQRHKHPFYQHSQAAFWLALDGERVAGRLAALDNRRFNQFNRKQTAFFYLFECENSPAAAQGLFAAAFAWARLRGLDEMVGPRGFTVFDGIGLLVRGFDHRPAFGLPYNPAYYVDLIESLGFAGGEELVSGYLDAGMHFPEKIHRAAELLQKRRGLHVERFTKRSDLRPLVSRLRDLYNSALGGTTDNVPLTEAEAKTLAGQLLWLADPRLIKIVMKADQPVGFLFAYPDISAALQRTRGRLFPFGWLHLLRELRRTQWININGAGMIEGYRGLGGTAILFSEMYKSVTESRYRYADIVQIGMENENMQREMRDLGIDFYKAHRLYKQKL